MKHSLVNAAPVTVTPDEPRATLLPSPPFSVKDGAETEMPLNATVSPAGTDASVPVGNDTSSEPAVRSGSVSLSAAPQFAGLSTDVSPPPLPVHVAYVVAGSSGTPAPTTRTPSPSIQVVPCRLLYLPSGRATPSYVTLVGLNATPAAILSAPPASTVSGHPNVLLAISFAISSVAPTATARELRLVTPAPSVNRRVPFDTLIAPCGLL